ncbi:acyltransferase [Janibacter sp. YIM B02568]|uniref:acyltransferase n=1 Tax=Janibacter endophyticus TaxID=2806261 RepID=UPI001950CAB7|nr:acyltransferase [Janibacter endophyticus]MBM6545827.1 acyltransferase [Janibacter endophyticus]
MTTTLLSRLRRPAAPPAPVLDAPWGVRRWVGWVLSNRAWTRHHLVSYARMARARRANPGLVFQGPCFIGNDVRFEVREGYGRLVVGPFVHIGPHARLRAHEGTLRIGAKTVIGIRNTINTWIDIEIGQACIFADDIYVCDFDHVTDSLDVPIKDQGIVKSPVRVGDDVWVATKCVIIRGTDVGDQSVLAAGTIARGVYPARSIVAGVPGRVVRTRAPRSR